jgi:hypothetical protein
MTVCTAEFLSFPVSKDTFLLQSKH